MKRILMISFGDLYNFSGYANRVYNECKEITKLKEKIQLDIIIIDKESRKNKDSNAIKRFQDLNANNLFFYSYSLNDSLSLLKLVTSVKRDIQASEYDYIHCQSFLAGFLALLSFKSHIKGKLIYDMHGVIREEIKLRTKGYKLHIFKYLTKIIEKRIILNSYKVVSVTNKMESYLEKNYNYKKDKLSIIPCLYDSELFYSSSKIRDAARNELGISKKFTIIYSGSFNNWSKPEFILNEYLSIKNAASKATFLLILTRQKDEINNLLKNNLEENEYLVITVDNNEVNKYLNAADLSLLIREDNPINNYAFPTKFSEYLGAGLPVIASKNIGHIDQIKSEIGLPFEGDLKEWIYNYQNNEVRERIKYHNFAKDNLSWNKGKEMLMSLYK